MLKNFIRYIISNMSNFEAIQLVTKFSLIINILKSNILKSLKAKLLIFSKYYINEKNRLINLNYKKNE